ncbi:MAG: dTMP kinase [Poseidonia sp.]
MTSQGKLIVIEGPDHVGRSLHARLLMERLEAHGVAVRIVGLARSELLGELIKTTTTELHQLSWRTRALLYATDLHDQYIHDIKPLLDAGFVVIADRYTLTPLIRETIRGGDPRWIEGLYNTMPKPDMTVILEAGGRRLLNRMMYNDSLTQLNHYEAGADMGLSPSITRSFLEYQKLLRKAFMEHANKEGIPLVHTREVVTEVHKAIWKHVKPCVAGMLQSISMG